MSVGVIEGVPGSDGIWVAPGGGGICDAEASPNTGGDGMKGGGGTGIAGEAGWPGAAGDCPCLYPAGMICAAITAG